MSDNDKNSSDPIAKFEYRSNKTKELLKEYIELHTASIIHEHGKDSTFLDHNGKMSSSYKLGLLEANLEYILSGNDFERERFEELVKFQRQKKEQRDEHERQIRAEEPLYV